jgi:hypothetical protein
MFGLMTEKGVKVILNDVLGNKVDEIPVLIQEAKDLIGPAEDVSALKKEIKELKLQKTMEEREIKHLVTLKQEKLDIEHRKRELELQAKFNKKEMDMQEKYHKDVLGGLEAYNKRQDKFFEQVMKRLPNVTAHVGGPFKGGK